MYALNITFNPLLVFFFLKTWGFTSPGRNQVYAEPGKINPEDGHLLGMYLLTGYLPGTAAPGIDVPSDAQVVDCPFLQPIGLVYQSLKKSICRTSL